MLAGFAGSYFSRGNLTAPTANDAAQRLLQIPLSDIAGKPQTMSQWRGKVLVVNFWATWCAPCQEEIPALIKVHHKYERNGVQFVGIALDNVSKVRDYVDEIGIDYAVLIGGIEILGVTKELGNRAQVLPFTVVLDRAGKAAYTHAGVLTEASLGAVLAPLL